MAFLDNGEVPNIISAANSTAALLAGGATFTGAWESVIDYTTVACAVLGSLATDGTLYFDLSMDGGATFTSVPNTVSDTTFALPRILNVVESHVRIRYVNGTTAMTGTFSLQTKYSNGQELGLLGSIDGFISGETPSNVVKSILAGRQPNGSYNNTPLDGQAFLTTANLPNASTFDSGILDMNNYTQIQTEVIASHNGLLTFTFYEDSAGANAVRTITVPYNTNSGFQFFSAPTFGYYVRYQFLNNSGAAQTSFFFTTKFLTKALSAQVLAKNGFVASAMTAGLVKVANNANSDRNEGLAGGQESKRKFGVNESVGASLETIWSYTANWIPNQVINEKLIIAAGGNAADTAAGLGAQSVIVNFLDENLAEVTETLVTAGAAASAATTANCFRVVSAKVVNSGTYHETNTGAITLTLTGGNIMGYIAASRGTTEQAILAIPANKIAYITEILVSVGQGDSADIKMFIVDNITDLTTPFGSKRLDWSLADFSGANIFKLDTHLKIPAGSEVWFEGQRIKGSGSARINVDFNYYTVEQ